VARVPAPRTAPLERIANVSLRIDWAFSARSVFVGLVGLALLAGCATLPPGADYPKAPSVAFDQPRTTHLGRQAATQSDRHPGLSGFRLFPRGVDGLLLRTQLIRETERSLDIQYYIFVEDHTGKLLIDELRRAADRGVRVRLLLDDLNSYRRPDTQSTLATLSEHAKIEVRLFNPFAYRGDVALLRRIDLLLNAPRVNHRMHNKLIVADGAVAIVGGRNVADEYFDTGVPMVRFADFDVTAVGPVVPELARSFDAYWNSSLAIPQEAVASLAAQETRAGTTAPLGAKLDDAAMKDLMLRLEKGDPLRGMVEGTIALSWAKAIVVVDPPEKATPPNDTGSSPTARVLNGRMEGVTRELVIISPYLIPGPTGLAVLEDLRKREARVRVLTNSLASTDVPVVHSAYRRYRPPLLDAGVEIFEVRPAPGQTRSDRESFGSGSSGSGGSGAPFALHAKAYVFDRERVFLGSANLDPRSLELNTEVGLLIESPELARQVLAMFDEFAASSNSYRVVRESSEPFGPALRWQTNVDGQKIEWTHEPDTTSWQRMKSELLSLLPIEGQL
jgi:putative cardiolipin synthase